MLSLNIYINWREVVHIKLCRSCSQRDGDRMQKRKIQIGIVLTHTMILLSFHLAIGPRSKDLLCTGYTCCLGGWMSYYNIVAVTNSGLYSLCAVKVVSLSYAAISHKQSVS